MTTSEINLPVQDSVAGQQLEIIAIRAIDCILCRVNASVKTSISFGTLICLRLAMRSAFASNDARGLAEMVRMGRK
jgi:hypothetical protein